MLLGRSRERNRNGGWTVYNYGHTLSSVPVSTQMGIDYGCKKTNWTWQQKENTLGEYLCSSTVENKKCLQKEKKMNVGKNLATKISREDR